MANEVTKTYTLDQLNSDYVNVLIESSVNIEGQAYKLPNSRISYSNSTIGRQKIEEELPEPYSTAIFAVWGDQPTIQDPAPPYSE